MSSQSALRQTIFKVFTRKHRLNLGADAMKYLLEVCETSGGTNQDIKELLDVVAAGYMKQEDDLDKPVCRASLESVINHHEKAQAVTMSSSRQQRASKVSNRMSNAMDYDEYDDQENDENVLRYEDDDEMDTDLPVTKERAGNPHAYFHVINSFQVPKYAYNAVEGRFSKVTEPPSLFASATSKIAMYRDRFDLIKQRVLRTELFRPPPQTMLKMAVARKQQYQKITPIVALKGCKPGRFTLFGMLTVMADGKWYLEDPDTLIELENFALIKDQIKRSDGFFTETSFVLLNGKYTINKTFEVETMVQPPDEARNASLASFGSTVDFFGAPKEAQDYATIERLEKEMDEAYFVILSDVWLDQPTVLAKLKSMLQVYSQMTPPVAFIFMGNFSSTPYVYNGAEAVNYKENFNALADILAAYPTLTSSSKFLFIPGPGDPCINGGGGAGGGGSASTCSTASLRSKTMNNVSVRAGSGGGVLPRGKIPEFFYGKLRRLLGDNAVWCSNPCRIKYCTQEILIFREDLLSKIRRNSIVPEVPTEPDERVHLIKTVLSQAHLCPMPLSKSPVYWSYDHALRVYPAPDIMILADRPEAYSMEVNDVLTMNPGPFAVTDFGFLVYYPHLREVEISKVFDEVA